MCQSSIRNQSCAQPKCVDTIVAIHGRSPLRFQCSSCKRTWVAHKKSLYFGLRAPKQIVDRALLLLKNGQSVRQIAKWLKVSPSTVQRWKRYL